MQTAYQNIQIAGGDTGQPLTMSKRLDVIRRHLASGGGRFIDCGCGCGEYVAALHDRLGLDAWGIEFDEEKVRQAQDNPLLQGRVSAGDLQAIDRPDGAFDYALLNEVLEHVPDERKALSEVRRIVKPGGLVFVFSPNRWFPFETHGVHWRRSGKRVPHWVPLIPYIPLPVGNLFFDYWARNYWQRELAEICRGSGLDIIERNFIWLTFEGISGNQPRLVTNMRPVLRAVSQTCERLPLIRRFGVTQVLVCRR